MGKENYAVVTGASQGIGKAIAMELGRLSYDLVLVALPKSGLQETAESLKNRFSVKVISYETDLSEQDKVHQFYNFVQELKISVKVWINNAGVGYQGALHSIDPSFFEKLLHLNMHTLANLSRLYVKDLKETGKKGYLLNVGSMASFFPLPYKSAYAASKSFVLNFSKSLREEVKADGISVSCVCPGPVKTNEAVSKRIGSTYEAKFFMTTPEKLARLAVSELFKKKSVIIPGFQNKILAFISYVVPHKLILLVTRNIFSRKITTTKQDIQNKPKSKSLTKYLTGSI